MIGMDCAALEMDCCVDDGDGIPMEPSVEYGAHRRIKMMMRSSLE